MNWARWRLNQNVSCFNSFMSGALSAVTALFMTWQGSISAIPEDGLQVPEWREITRTAHACTTVCTGVGERLHTLTSHPTCGSSWGFSLLETNKHTHTHRERERERESYIRVMGPKKRQTPWEWSDYKGGISVTYLVQQWSFSRLGHCSPTHCCVVFDLSTKQAIDR